MKALLLYKDIHMFAIQNIQFTFHPIKRVSYVKSMRFAGYMPLGLFCSSFLYILLLSMLYVARFLAVSLCLSALGISARTRLFIRMYM